MEKYFINNIRFQVQFVYIKTSAVSKYNLFKQKILFKYLELCEIDCTKNALYKKHIIQ